MQRCLDRPQPKLHEKLTCVMLAHSPQTTLHQKIIYNFVLIYLGQHCMRNCLWNVGSWLRYNFYEEDNLYNIVSTMLEYCPVNVVQICSRQHCTRKLLVQCQPKAHRYTFAEKLAVSNMSGSLVLTRYYITEKSWLFLFKIGSRVHLRLAGQQ